MAPLAAGHAAEGPEFQFTAGNRAQFEEFASHYPPSSRKSAVLHALYLAQEQQGYISANATRHVAEVIGCTTAEVEDVVSYYVMFYREPVGKYVLQVCTHAVVRAAGAERVIEEIRRQARHQGRRDRPDRHVHDHRMECLGACDRAPVMMVNNDHWHECLHARSRPAALVDRMKADG